MIKSEVLIAGALSAMNGLLADPEDNADLVEPGETCPEAVARIAVDHAQALVAELVKRGELK